ncbi:NUDIX hydrolase domain-like protein [Fomitopsis serialis]|uniref:NUDIX hydrolase domain-like protein n=1 Tax=Fomitopsis serialis TaxID=139415 RepID=UPI00200789B5|nr:NUDIX hydrolase domain-like protein [Neoantrodia serialis]KAH9925323.1 NUDIX hydrolase domain-like protein [Neoantrodia serialis]
MPQSPKILSKEDLPTSEAKWVALKKLYWSDQEGKQRTWECAERTTRGSSGIDAVAILAILRSESNAFQPSTVIIEQYRPPVDKYVIGKCRDVLIVRVGLIDEGETAEEAAIRELQEETGFKASKVLDSSPCKFGPWFAHDGNGLTAGMTTANMKLVAVDVPFPDKLEQSAQKLEPGEYITARIVELAKLADELKEYEKKVWMCVTAHAHCRSLSLYIKGFVVDARLSHFAIGIEMARDSGSRSCDTEVSRYN